MRYNGKEEVLRDVVILPHEFFSWNWHWNPDNKMAHSPGIREEDIQELILKKLE